MDPSNTGYHFPAMSSNGNDQSPPSIWVPPSHQMHPHSTLSPLTSVPLQNQNMPASVSQGMSTIHVIRPGGHPSPDSSTPCTSASSTSSSSPKESNGGSNGTNKRKDYAASSGGVQKRTQNSGQPYIPSYMDLSNGPEPCVVCSDAATGYHYRCMTCEGCKGFFRRTIQKNLQYHCKWNSSCVIDKTTRNQCQSCRFKKCVTVGMATDLVLNEKQRVAKRKLIEDNRERRRDEHVKVHVKQDPCYYDELTDEDRHLIDEIICAYEETSTRSGKPHTLQHNDSNAPADTITGTDPDVWQQLAEVMTPSIVRVVEFAKRVPGFLDLDVDDQILLLKSCCMEIMCLRAACRFDPHTVTLTLHNGLVLTRDELGSGGLGMLVEPIFDFAVSLAKLQLDSTEVALLAAVLLMQSDRTGLKESEAVEQLQDSVLGAYKRYIAEKRPSQPVHWAKILMKVTDLRSISTRHAERVLCIKLDSPDTLPPMFLEMFDEGGQNSKRPRKSFDESNLAHLDTIPQLQDAQYKEQNSPNRSNQAALQQQ